MSLKLQALGFVLASFLPLVGAAADPLFGVNLSGLEMGSGDNAGTDYAIPDPDYMESQHVAVMRLPFSIERLQPVAGGALDASYSSYISSVIKKNVGSGVVTVLDPHNYGYISNDGTTREIGVDPVGTSEYISFVAALASSSRDVPLLAIGLMNEPHSQSCAQLTPVWQQAVTAIRQAGFQGPIMVPPTNWSHADTLVSSGCGSGFLTLSDPVDNLVFEVHNYLDPNESGTYSQSISSVTIGSQQLAPAISWALQNQRRLFVGETGTPPDAYSVSALDDELQTIRKNATAFWGVTLWAAGPWWPVSYPLRLDPVDGVPVPQMVDLANYL